ncbi:hypothetical protein NQ315_008695 [Exocentrus adspersus]|uniref:Uncharacterized protein n=1 Tax=Exocentrus adspersus TaxID=1586481 RepID=A0AAV8W6I6_9CUCU|nr:hypothetical protein NQ315_008695 [Exocentrus adspersus]
MCFTASYVKECKRSDPKFDECVKQHAIEAIPSILKGDKEYNYPKLDPLNITEITLNTGTQLSIKLKDIVLSGLNGIKIEDIRIDLKKQTFYMKSSFASLSIDGIYTVDGQILVVPVKGTGPFHLTCENMVVDYSFDYKLMKGPDGKDYVDPDLAPKLTYTVQKINVQLENLFNGNKELGDRTNEFLNEHALEINNEFKDTFVEAINAVSTSVLKNIVQTVPYEEVYPY